MTARLGARLLALLADARRADNGGEQALKVVLEVHGADPAALEAAGLHFITGTEPALSGMILPSNVHAVAEVPGVRTIDQVSDTAGATRWPARGLGLVIGAVLLLLLGAFVPAMQAASALDANQPAKLSYLGWTATATKPGVFVVVSLIGGALGGALHGLASLTAHVAAGDFGARWTMWYLANPVVGAALATVFLFVLQAGLGGQAAPTTGGLYGIAAVATLTGLFSRHALNKLRDIFDVAFASRPAVDSGAPASPASGTGTTDNGAPGSGSGPIVTPSGSAASAAGTSAPPTVPGQPPPSGAP